MLTETDDSARAIAFIENNAVAVEMLYSEFEAILDSFIPLPDYAGRNVQAVYIEIDSQLCITAAVFFLIQFDKSGFPDKSWNVPLQTLAESSARGPNLGAGPIRLACYTQCPVPWQQRNLWDPDLSPGTNHLTILRKAVHDNKLGLAFKPKQEETFVDEDDAIPTLTMVEEKRFEKAWREDLEDELKAKLYKGFRNRLADTLKKQRLQLATVRNKHRQKLDALNREHQSRVERYKAQIDELNAQLQSQNSVVLELKATIENQAEKMANVREYFEEKLKGMKSIGEGQLSILNQQFELEAAAKIEAATTELKEQLQLKDIEIMYLTEHQKNLNDELENLRDEKSKAQHSSGDKILDELCEAGISFVAYQTGIGHLNISKDEVTKYMDSPEAFSAEKCGVSLPTYRAWMDHFTNPCCQAINKDGSVCAKPVSRVTSPLDFHSGESDRCEEHKQSNVVQFNFGK